MTAADPSKAQAWPVAALQNQLQAEWPGLQVHALATVDSTNTRVHAWLRSEPAVARLLVAEAQTQGRGRNGRTWHAMAGTSLTFTVGLPFAPVDWSGLSLAVGVALAEAIDPAADGAPPRLQLKWPNDLWLRDECPGRPDSPRWRKLGGILIETVAAGPVRAALVGVGLNVLPRADVQGLSSGYACVQELDAAVTAPALLMRVAPALLRALRRFEREGLAPSADGFAHRDLLRGRAIETSQAESLHGDADGIDAQGALRVRHAAGVTLVHSGEVSVRPRMPADRLAAALAPAGDA